LARIYNYDFNLFETRLYRKVRLKILLILIYSNLSLHKFTVTKTVLFAIVNCLIISSFFPNIDFDLMNKVNAQPGHQKNVSFIGVNMKGLYSSTIPKNLSSIRFPDNYYNDSFKLITSAGMNHIRDVLYWQAYEKDPLSFIKELQTVASLADKWGLHVIYDNHQFHTSSWLDPVRGDGFPPSLFNDNTSYPFGSGGSPGYPSAVKWWTKWWNHNITDNRGIDGWTLQIGFLKKIIETVENHRSTLGYEILNEPQIQSADQWEKIGKYNTLIANELRKITNKTLVFDMTIPVVFHDLKINMTLGNIAKLLPENKNNIVFKISLYGKPTAGSYAEQKINLLSGVAKITGVPLYVGEWNDVSREEHISVEGKTVKEINQEISDLNQTDANIMTKKFKDIGVWGWAFWNWSHIPDSSRDFNLITVTLNGDMVTTKYFDILKQAVANT
jgi:Cellulase (glycosyl hydrolase family 5)